MIRLVEVQPSLEPLACYENYNLVQKACLWSSARGIPLKTQVRLAMSEVSAGPWLSMLAHYLLRVLYGNIPGPLWAYRVP